MHRFFIPQVNGYQLGHLLSFPKELVHQLAHVLRMKAGAQVTVLDNVGCEYQVTLTAVTRSHVSGKIISKHQAQGEPAVHLTLYQSLTRREKFEWVLQKGTEVGISRFVPMVTQRSLVQETAVKPNKITRWHKIVTEAAEQSHRGIIPLIEQPVSFSTALTMAQKADLRLIAVPGMGRPLSTASESRFERHKLALFIGPEGGFTDAEIKEAQFVHVSPITFGPRIYRTETAAVVGAALVLHEFDQT